MTRNRQEKVYVKFSMLLFLSSVLQLFKIKMFGASKSHAIVYISCPLDCVPLTGRIDSPLA